MVFKKAYIDPQKNEFDIQKYEMILKRFEMIFQTKKIVMKKKYSIYILRITDSQNKSKDIQIKEWFL